MENVKMFQPSLREMGDIDTGEPYLLACVPISWSTPGLSSINDLAADLSIPVRLEAADAEKPFSEVVEIAVTQVPAMLRVIADQLEKQLEERAD